MLRLRLGQTAICSGSPILARHGHSANMGTKSRQRRFDDPIVLTDGISKVRRPDARRAFS
jgi:hypothetical protein